MSDRIKPIEEKKKINGKYQELVNRKGVICHQGNYKQVSSLGTKQKFLDDQAKFLSKLGEKI